MYKSLIRPVITYGSAVCRLAAKTQHRRIQVFENHELRRYVKAFRLSRNDVIHRNLKVQPLYFLKLNLQLSFTGPFPICGILR